MERSQVRQRTRKRPRTTQIDPVDVPTFRGHDTPALLVDVDVTPCYANNYGILVEGRISTRAERRHLLTGWATDATLRIGHRRKVAHLLMRMGGRCSCKVCAAAVARAEE